MCSRRSDISVFSYFISYFLWSLFEWVGVNPAGSSNSSAVSAARVWEGVERPTSAVLESNQNRGRWAADLPAILLIHCTDHHLHYMR
jgi:hypothetical protein